MKKYYILDLERSVLSGSMFYWKPHRRGYTRDISEAGLYDRDAAVQIAADDVDRRTILLDAETVDRLIKNH